MERKETTLSEIMQEREQVKTDVKWGEPLKESIIQQKREEEEAMRSRKGSENSFRSKNSPRKASHQPNEQASFVSDEEGAD